METRDAWLAILVVIGAAACSPSPNPPERDADGWTQEREDVTASGLELGRAGDDHASFTPYPDEGAELRLVHGFQGGYHLEPAIYLTDGPTGEFEADIHYDVRRPDSDQRLNRREKFTITHHGWMDYQGGLLHYSNPVILAISSAEEIAGEKLRLEIRVDIQNGPELSATTTATVVDTGRP